MPSGASSGAAALGEAFERGLGHRVDEVSGRHERRRLVRGAVRRDVHDAPATHGHHVRRDRAREHVEAAHVDAHRLVPLARRSTPRAGHCVGAIALFTSTSSRPNLAIGLVDQMMDVAGLRRCRSGSRRAEPPAASISRAVSWIVPGSPPGVSTSERAAHTTDAPSPARPTREPLADPARRAGDDHDATREVGGSGMCRSAAQTVVRRRLARM